MPSCLVGFQNKTCLLLACDTLHHILDLLKVILILFTLHFQALRTPIAKCLKMIQIIVSPYFCSWHEKPKGLVLKKACCLHGRGKKIQERRERITLRIFFRQTFLKKIVEIQWKLVCHIWKVSVVDTAL